MTSPATLECYKHHRFPTEIISHSVWLYYRFCLSYRDVEELLFVRGVLVSYEAIRQWCRKFGPAYANQLRRRRPRPGDKWHLEAIRKPLSPIMPLLSSLRAIMKSWTITGNELVQHKMDITNLEHGSTCFYSAFIVLAVPSVPTMPSIRTLNHPAFC
jgi:hypothetical protein